MRLRSRRVWCGLAGCLLIVVSVVVPPIRQQVVQCALRYSTGADIGFSQIKLYPRAQVLEVQNLRATVHNDRHQLGMNVEQAMLRIALPQVLAKQFVAPKVKLTNVDIRVSEVLAASSTAAVTPPTATWQSKLDTLLDGMQWDKLRQECDSLLAADDILKELDSKMQRWLVRSQQILLHATQLTQSIQAFPNPLRHTLEIRRQLQLLEDLAREQAELDKQLAGVETDLSEQLATLPSSCAQDMSRIKTKSAYQLTSLRTEAAKSLAEAWATELWRDQAALAQATCLLLQPPVNESPFDVDVRRLARDAALVSLPHISVDGKLTHGTRQTAFRAKGDLRIGQSSDFHPLRASTWDIEFQRHGALTSMAMELRSADATWRLNSSCRALTVDHPVLGDPAENSKLEHATKRAADIFTVEADFATDELRGSAKLNVESIGSQGDATEGELEGTQWISMPLADTLSLADNLSRADNLPAATEWITFELSGDWENWNLKLASPLPTAFVERQAHSAAQQLDRHRVEIEEQLDLQLALRCQQVQLKVKEKMLLAQQTLTQHRESLAGMRSELENTLQTREGYEYARAPLGTPTKTR